MEEAKRTSRRPHSAERRARVLAECLQPGASVAKIAMTHGLNANLVHKWRRASEGAIARPATHALTHEGAGAFIALAMPPQAVAAALADIRIELRRGATAMTITWPSAASADCAAWIRELLVEPRR